MKAEDTAARVPPPLQSSPAPSSSRPSDVAQPSQLNALPVQVPASSSGAPSATPFPAIPASVRIPIVVGPVPASHASGGGSGPPKPIVLHENTLILNPEIFSHLTPQHLQDLEALGAQKALEVLQAYIVRYYKEKLKAEGGRGRGRGRPRRGRGGPPGRGATPAGASARADVPSTGPFTTAPLPPRVPKPAGAESLSPGETPPVATPTPAASIADPPSPIVVVDDDEPSEPVTKRRRLDEPTVDVTSM